MNKNDVIFMVGPQGSGKGTQAKIFAERFGFFWWDMGQVLREERNWKFKDGRTVGEIIDTGALLSDDQVLEVFNAKVATISADQGIIFDGIPRRVGQAEYLMDFLKRQGRANFTTLYVSLPREESMKRLLKRAQTEKRQDDTPEGIELRLKMYEDATIPVLEYLKAHTTFIQINGIPPIPEVTKEIEEALGK